MPPTRRIPSWLLIVATGAICVGMLKLESADLFPVWRFAVQWSPEALLSSSAIPAREIARGVAILSLTLDEADLKDSANGLLANVTEHGNEWEREAAFHTSTTESFVCSGVGVRIHGGSSRRTSARQGFRRTFVANMVRDRFRRHSVQSGCAADSPPRRAQRSPHPGQPAWSFVNSLAYDIAREIDAIAPEPTGRFYVNGEYYGPFVLTERFDERFLLRTGGMTTFC